MTKQLSPAAQAVASAYDDTPEKDTGNHRYLWLAAALRAAADQVVPDLPEPTDDGTRQADTQMDYWEDCQQHREKLLAIAAELEAQ